MASSFDEKLLDPLLKRAEETNSDALVVMHQGKLVGTWRFGKPKQLIQTMSITKSIVNLAIGKLVTDGLLASIDEPVCTFYPEWKQGRKKNITTGHIMSHRSGLQNVPRTNLEIYPSPDHLQLALCAELESEPGEKFAYNNKAVNLLAGIVERITRQKLDDYMKDVLFTPLGISEFFWGDDSVGNPSVMAGLALFPEDLAKLGQFVLNKGSWKNQQLIDESWFSLIKAQPTDAGLLWWLLRDIEITVNDSHIANLEQANVPPSILGAYRTLKGIYKNREFVTALQNVFGEDWLEVRTLLEVTTHRNVVYKSIYGYQANGDLGQYLYLFQKQQLVFVRMIHYESHQNRRDNFSEFGDIVLNIAKSL